MRIVRIKVLFEHVAVYRHLGWASRSTNFCMLVAGW